MEAQSGPPAGHSNGSAASAGSKSGVTLVLGGGGARGLAHLGVLRVLEREGIDVDAIVGTSAGAVMGAAWLQQANADVAIERVLGFLRSRAFGRLGLSTPPGLQRRGERPMLRRILSGWRGHVAMHLLFRRPSLFHRRRLEQLVRAAVEDGAIESLRKPLLVLAMDLSSGEPVILEQGALCDSLTASASVAGFFPPVTLKKKPLIDAGLSDNLPVSVALARGLKPVVAVNLSHDVDERSDFATGIEVLLRSGELGSRWNNRQRAQLADLEIAPRLGGRYWLDFSQPEKVIEAGEAAARAVVEPLRRLIGP